MKTVAVIIPIYKNLNELMFEEMASLSQCITILCTYQIILVAPKKLDSETYRAYLYNIHAISIKVELFSDYFFSSIAGYNQLLLSNQFYNCFLEYENIFIYQLDAWIFRDELEAWCNKGYDYIGAPWINWEWSSFYARHLTFPRRLAYKLGYRNFNLVGNGGLSLRKVKSCISNLERFKNAAAKFEQNEDYFFSLYITSYNPFFKIPPVKEALGFAFDENPEQAYELNNKQLPMGCHAWPKYNKFWLQFIKEFHQ